VLATVVQLAGQSLRSEVLAPLDSELSPSAKRLLAHLWESTLFVVGVWLLTRLLRRRPARVRYRLWMAASLKFFVPLSLFLPPGGQAAALAFPAPEGADHSWSAVVVWLAPPVWLAGVLTIVVVRLLAWRRIRTALRCSGDQLTAVLHFVTEAVFWFHPLVWWIGSRLRAERQRACDERAAGGGADAVRRPAAAAS
jgi:hypothetical protein